MLSGYENTVAVLATVVDEQHEFVLVEKARFHDSLDESLDITSACEKILAREIEFIKKAVQDEIPIVVDVPLDVSQIGCDGLRAVDRMLLASPPLASSLRSLSARMLAALTPEDWSQPLFGKIFYETYPNGILRLQFLNQSFQALPKISPGNTRYWSGNVISRQSRWMSDGAKADQSEWFASLLDELRIAPGKDEIRLTSNCLDAIICAVTGLVYSIALDASECAFPLGYRIPSGWPKKVVVML